MSLSIKRIVYMIGLIVGLLAAAGYGWRLHRDPNVPFLVNEQGAQWIRSGEYSIKSHLMEDTMCIFRGRFTVDQPPARAELVVRAMRQANVVLDGRTILETSADPKQWKQPYWVDLTSGLSSGHHELTVFTRNNLGPPCLLAYCIALGLATGPQWEWSSDAVLWSSVEPVDTPHLWEGAKQFPRADKALVHYLPLLLPLFIFVGLLTLFWAKLPGPCQACASPGIIRWGVIGLLVIQAGHNLFRLSPMAGYDAIAHIEYIRYAAENWRIPLATEGWQMFQQPLYYFVSAPLYILFHAFFSDDHTEQLLRILPLACGILHVEVCFRVLTILFPERKDLQSAGVVLAGFVPMNLYISHYISNESFAGLLIGLVILLSLRMLNNEPQVSIGHWLCIGIAFGLALLTKITAVLLAPALLLILLRPLISERQDIKTSVKSIFLRVIWVFGAALLIAGWYYVRNYAHMGRFFVGGWDPHRGFSWWQEPGYRTPYDFMYFGTALFYPVYASLAGFWDGIYATFWMDSFGGGVIVPKYFTPWNYGVLSAGMWLALLPTAAILLGIVIAAGQCYRRGLTPLVFTLLIILIFGAALVQHFLTNPNYCAAKAFYSLGALSCYAVLGTAGLEFLTRTRWLKPVVYGLLGCWAVASYIGHFIL
ncbi:MAG TPA: glycosyltransferase family 39 protein [Candidatus Hydrogenedentes bacterium]|nr:glycosyltransferase family 39 protein [Candidatus Hydrogenedentota bacterium]